MNPMTPKNNIQTKNKIKLIKENPQSLNKNIIEILTRSYYLYPWGMGWEYGMNIRIHIYIGCQVNQSLLSFFFSIYYYYYIFKSIKVFELWNYIDNAGLLFNSLRITWSTLDQIFSLIKKRYFQFKNHSLVIGKEL